MNLSDKMKNEAIGLGMCAQWTSEWEDNSSKDVMLDKFVTSIDFCIRHNWPSPQFIKDNAGDVMHGHGVYVDEAINLYNPKGVVVLNGSCAGSITFDGFTIATVYVRHTSKLQISVRGMSKVRVCLYDKAEVSVKCKGYGSCSIYRYGGKVVSNEGAKEKDRVEWFKKNICLTP